MNVVTALYHALTPRRRKQYVLLQAYFFVAAIAQVAGVGSIAPFVALVSNPSLMHSSPWAQRAYASMGFTSDTQALIFLAASTMAVLVVSNLIAAGTVWAIARFSFSLGLELQEDCYCAYLYRDYATLTRTNSSQLIASITQGATRLIYMVVQPMLILVSQVMIVLVVIIVLVVYQPQVAFSVALIVGGGYYLLFAVVRSILARHGKVSWSVFEAKQRLLAESLGGLKAIRLSSSEEAYRVRFSHLAQSGLHADALVATLGDLPRFVIETLAFCALLGLAIILLRSTARPVDVVAVLGLYATTGYRLLPAAQSVFKSASQIRANGDVVATLLPDFLEGRRAARATRRPVRSEVKLVGPIVVRDVHFTYPERVTPVVSGLSVDIRPNELTVLAGHSGSGKSTIADLLLGLLRPDSGTIQVCGHRLSEIQPEWQRHLGYVPQDIFVLDDTIAANIAFGSPFGVEPERLRSAARLANLETVIEALPGKYEFRVGERGALLSGGQRQRLGIARALYHDASVLILDEATSALDGSSELEVLDALLELRKTRTVVMIAHRMSTIAVADRILLIANGRIDADGTFDGLMQSSAEFRRMANANQPAAPIDEAQARLP